MGIRDLSDKILKLLYEYFTEHNAIDPMSEVDIVAFINKEESDLKASYIDAALEFLVESGHIKKTKSNVELFLFKITPDGVNVVENKNQLQQGQCPIFHIHGGNNFGFGSSNKDVKDSNLYYEASKQIPKYFDSANEVITSTRKLIQMYIEDKTITPQLIEEVDNRMTIMESLMYSEE